MSINSQESNGHNSNTSITTTTNSMSVDNDTSKDCQLMKHIIEHLRSKGLDHIANELQNETESKTTNKQNDKNGHLNRKRAFSEMNGESESSSSSSSSSYLSLLYENKATTNNKNSTNFVSDEQVMSAQDFSFQSFGEYSQLFVHSNKSEISCISFSANGAFNCIGSVDGNIRIFDVNKLHQSRNFNSLIKKYDSNSYSDIHRPLICTLCDTEATVNEIDFYPHLSTTQQLVSCNTAGEISIYEFSTQSRRKSSIHTIRECFNVLTVQYHPCGNYLLCAGESCYVRLYDIQQGQGYIAGKSDNGDYNINQIRYSRPGGNIFASCSDKGDIRLYDGRSLCVVNTLRNAHKSKAITSIRFSADNKYLLSCGGDNVVRLCDLRVGKECMNFKGGGDGQACFTYNDEHILSYSAAANRIFVYDTNSGHRISKFKEHASGSNENGITYLATSPREPAFMCASSNDNKNRFYATIKQMVAIDTKSSAQNILQKYVTDADDEQK